MSSDIKEDNKIESPEEILATLRNSFNSGLTKSVQYRKIQLKGLYKLCDENLSILLDALRDDLNKGTQESIVGEIDYLKNEALNMLYNLDDWTKPQHQDKELPNILDSVYLVPEPYGVALVIGAWNYPLQLTLAPVIGAIAAGNCCVIKPSEIAPATAKVIAELVPKYLDSRCYKVYQGGPAETTRLLEQKFDYIFYTGSTKVGGIVAQAAAKHLTPTTLELGGKSPVYIDSTVDIDIAAARVLWGKTMNGGQICIAPDYLLCTQEIEKKFIEAFKRAQIRTLGADPKTSPDYCRIINSSHFNRIVALLKGQEIAHGGDHDASQRYISPTICVNVDPNSPLMQEEIFGPVLPIVRVNDASEAINFINAREKPLALYIFSNDKRIVELFEKQTSSGGICVNDTLMHFICPSLPFGGVGHSGVGAYHGKYSFDTFCHNKPVLSKSCNKLGEMMQNARYPPYSESSLKMLSFLTKKRQSFISTKTLVGLGLIAFGVVTGYCCSKLFEHNKSC